MATVIDSYNGSGVTLGSYIDSILKQNDEEGGVQTSPHRNFWGSMSYADFTTGNVPGINFGPGPPYPILKLGDGAGSNFVQALQGTGPLFDNNTGAFGQMPANANPPAIPFFTADQVAPIAAWIDSGCPNPGGADEGVAPRRRAALRGQLATRNALRRTAARHNPQQV